MSSLTPSERVIQAVAVYSNTEPLELPPLGDAIDLDALDAAIGTMEDGQIDFRYAGYAVTVHSDGTVDVVDQSDDSAG